MTTEIGIDRRVWETAYEENSRALGRFVRRRIPRIDDAEDVVHETFARAIRAAPEIVDPSSLRAYLFTTARNLLVNRFRRRRPLLFSDAGPEDGWAAGIEDTSTPDPESTHLETELSRRFGEALERLSDGQRRAFRGAVLEGKSYRRVAREQGWTLEQVKVNVYRARRSLLRRLGPELGKEDR